MMYEKFFLVIGTTVYLVDYNSEVTNPDEIIGVVKDYLVDDPNTDAPASIAEEDMDELVEHLEVDFDSTIVDVDDIRSYNIEEED